MPEHLWSVATAASLDWFQHARFGMFIHWGLYAVPAGAWQGREVPYIGEWIQHEERIPNRDYERLALGFTGAGFDAKSWVETAKRAGMRYVVLTAKHHEGFALWPSRCDPFNIDASACHRDIIGELAMACHAAGIRLGLYYSHCVDWHEAHGGNLPDDVKEPTREAGQGRMWGNDWDFQLGTAAGFDAYLRGKVEPQLRELLTSYGDIALVWFDTPTAGLQLDQARRLRDLVKSIQPGCLVGGRIGHGLQDFDCLGDNQVPHAALTRPGESCMTLNDTWGYKAHDHAWAGPEEVIALLAACSAKGCNLLLNIGPTAEGVFPAPAIDCLAAVGRWMDANGSAIFGSTGAVLWNAPDWGEVTTVASTLHLLITDAMLAEVSVPCPQSAVLAVRDVSGCEQAFRLVDGPAGAWLVIPLAPAVEGMPRRLSLVCAEPPVWDATPSEDPAGALILPASSARDDDGQPWGGYSSAGRRVCWRIRCARPGRFRAAVICGGDRYGDWYGGHTVEISSGGRILNGVLLQGTVERGRRWAHYPAVCSELGELELIAGEQDIALVVITTAGPAAASLPFLRLHRVVTAP